jgi:hypothetical protein
MFMSKCQFCGAEFIPKVSWQTHCSPACRIEEKKTSARAARRLWQAAGKPSEDEVIAMGQAAE